MKDRGWEEDKHSLKHGQNMFVELTNAALSLLNLMKMPNERCRNWPRMSNMPPEKLSICSDLTNVKLAIDLLTPPALALHRSASNSIGATFWQEFFT